MKTMNTISPVVDELVRVALAEDIGSGDKTTSLLVDPECRGHARVIAKEMLVIAGFLPFMKVFQILSSKIEFVFFEKEGSVVREGDTVAELKGPYSVLLTGERTALNFLQRLCGIATNTYHYVEKIKLFGTVLFDTRKTTPGWRALEKEAVRLGGGTNHRMGLFDAVLIKDNHIAACGGIRTAVEKVKEVEVKGPRLTLEVEVKNMEEFREALDAGPDMIMLDNMSIEEIKQAVKTAGGKIPLEASGNITLESIEKVAATGVNYISAGAVTHSSRAVDMSMIIEPEN
jgi:nicotinate-nucleotide pyrophosphorylase (carboxylating)